MEPVVKFLSPQDHYTADACVVWCFDDRFYKLLKSFGKQEKWKNIDLVKLAGGAKALAEGASAGSASPEHDVVLGQIRASIRLHGTRRIILMTHRDCGGYGGSKNFENQNAEFVFHQAQLKAAKECVNREIPGVPVDTYFADFDGLYAVE